MEIISSDAGTQFTSKEFHNSCQTCGVQLTLAALENQEMIGQVKVKRRTLGTIAHSIMVHAQVSEAYIHFVIMYTTYHIFPVLLIKDLINKDGETFVPFKIVTGTKTSILHLHVLFFPCVAQKATERVGIKALNMCHQV